MPTPTITTRGTTARTAASVARARHYIAEPLPLWEDLALFVFCFVAILAVAITVGWPW